MALEGKLRSTGEETIDLAVFYLIHPLTISNYFTLFVLLGKFTMNQRYSIFTIKRIYQSGRGKKRDVHHLPIYSLLDTPGRIYWNTTTP